MFVSNFEAKCHVTLVLRSENRPDSWRKKRSHSKTAEVRRKTIHVVVCFKILFHPYQPTFGHDEVYFFFCFFFVFLFLSFFFLFNSRTLLISYTTKYGKKFLCKIVKLQTQFCFPKFCRPLLQEPLKWGPKFFERLKLRIRFLYQQIFRRQLLGHTLEVPPSSPGTPQIIQMDRQKLFFWLAEAKVLVFFCFLISVIVDIRDTNILT